MSFQKLKSILGFKAFVTPDDVVVSKGAFGTGGEGEPSIVLPGSRDIVAVFDDFLGDTLADEWNAVEGDTGNSQAVVAGTNGIHRLTVSGTVAAAPGSGVGLNGGLLQWKPNAGPDGSEGYLRMSARIKVGSNVNDTGRRMSLFVGFTDSVAAEMPIYDTGAGPITTASDAVGFMLGSRADTGWSGVAVAADTDRTAISLDTGQKVGVYDDLEIVVRRGNSDTGGAASFFINGVPVGRIDSPVTSTVALTPAIYAFPEDTGGGMTVDIDYINVSSFRDTGA